MPPKRRKLLSSSRPQPVTQAKTPKLSSRTTQSIISKHHTLQKQLAQARKTSDTSKSDAIQAEIEANGGLRLYQQASTQGQSRDRGGDTSKLLVEWLGLKKTTVVERSLRVLEVGALSTTNALNMANITQVRRIDLHSQESGIEEMDFMAMRPEEAWQGQKGYDVLSLSLVVNYVSDPKARGQMLEHTVGFLQQRRKQSSDLLPTLFLVLPLSCIDNSRYLTEERLAAIMASLGYRRTKAKRSSKLYYSLWKLLDDAVPREDEQSASRIFKKVELRSGRDRNNFCIVLDGESHGRDRVNTPERTFMLDSN